MSVTPTILKARLPEFADIDDDVVQDWLDSCVLELNFDRWGPQFDEGHLFLTAHSMVRGGVLNSNAGSKMPVGALASMAVGPVSKSYSVSIGSGVDSDLETTTYGKLFLRKMRTLVRSPVLI